MLGGDLTDADLATITKLLRETNAADHYPLSPAHPQPSGDPRQAEAPAAASGPLPPLKPPAQPSLVMAKKRRR